MTRPMHTYAVRRRVEAIRVEDAVENRQEGVEIDSICPRRPQKFSQCGLKGGWVWCMSR